MEGFDQLTMNWRSALLGLSMVCSAIALAFLARRGIERNAIRWLVVFVIAANIAAIPMLIGFAGAYDIWPGLTFLPTQTFLLFGPAIALHAAPSARGVVLEAAVQCVSRQHTFPLSRCCVSWRLPR